MRRVAVGFGVAAAVALGVFGLSRADSWSGQTATVAVHWSAPHASSQGVDWEAAR
jgi:hypothetical protein